MARRPEPTPRSAAMSDAQVRAALPKLKRRLNELSALDVFSLPEKDGGNILDGHSTKINSTLRDVFGADTLEYSEYHVQTFRPEFSVWFEGLDDSLRGNIDEVDDKVKKSITTLKSIIEIFEERAGDEGENGIQSTIRAYGGLDLHREIARAANKLYQDGHYANLSRRP
ncbi:MAG: hypothetical protein E5Y30_26710 [Mesorhizobium sp.]|nr:MAG: hypothetical protein E5Y30_26710 [Mesorhizobium sp.]